LVFNIRRISSLANAPAPSSATPQSQETEKQKIISSIQRDIIRPIVACCLTFGLDDAIDSNINEAFGVLASPGCGGITGWAQAYYYCHGTEASFRYGNSLALINRLTPNSVWTISREYTAWRLLTISSILRMCLAIDGKFLVSYALLF
jgi:hypothetical protein